MFATFLALHCCVPGCFSHVPLCDPMDYSPPGSFVHGILQARIAESVAISCSRHCVSTRKVKIKKIFPGLPGGPVVKNLPANAGDMGSIPDREGHRKPQGS